MTFKCRHCSENLNDHILDLGHQPPSNNYLTKEQLELPESTYPLKVFICSNCGLVQLPEFLKPEELFNKNYPYFSSTSSSWCLHAKNFVKKAIKKLSLNQYSNVIEIASNDGYLLQYVDQENIPCIGIEPTEATALASKKKGIKTIEEFFNSDLASQLEKADLLIANNVVAHVPNINDFMNGISIVLKINGLASIEFPHLLNIVKFNQFDTIYHEHYSYLSLTSFRKIALQANLDIIEVEEISTHGGSLRVWLSHKNKCQISKNVNDIIDLEKKMKLTKLDGFRELKENAKNVKFELLNFLLQAKEENELVVAYGAAAKGNTLLNYCGIDYQLLELIVDKAKSKQGLFMPGSHIPIKDLKSLEESNPDKILVLPWNIINEITTQQKGFKLYTAIPKLKIHT